LNDADAAVTTAAGGPAAPAARFVHGHARASRLARLRPFVPVAVLLLLCVVITVIAPNFLTEGNFRRVGIAAAIPMVLACGMTFVILLGSIDLSTEGIVAVSAVALSLLVRNLVGSWDLGLWALPVPILLGAALGFLNGAVHVRLRIPSMIASLGVGFACIGVATVVLGGITVRINDPMIRGIALTRLLGIPFSVWTAFACILVAWLIQSYTRLGRWSYVLGGGEDIAKLSGIPVGRVRIGIYTLAGFFYGIGGILCVAQFGQSQALIAQGYLFSVITSVVVGGTALTGGEGGILNTVIGVLLVTVLGNGMILVGVPPYVQQGVQGLLIIVAVALSIDRTRVRMVK
jgi:ribose transport system permease protein